MPWTSLGFCLKRTGLVSGNVCAVKRRCCPLLWTNVTSSVGIRKRIKRRERVVRMRMKIGESLPSATKLRRLCFYTCVSVHRGGGLPQCILGYDTPLKEQAPPSRRLLLRTVRILLECILVYNYFRFLHISMKLLHVYCIKMCKILFQTCACLCQGFCRIVQGSLGIRVRLHNSFSSFTSSMVSVPDPLWILLVWKNLYRLHLEVDLHVAKVEVTILLSHYTIRPEAVMSLWWCRKLDKKEQEQCSPTRHFQLKLTMTKSDFPSSSTSVAFVRFCRLFLRLSGVVQLIKPLSLC